MMRSKIITHKVLDMKFSKTVLSKPIFDFEFKMPMFNDDIKFCVQGQTKGQEDFQEFQPVQWVRNYF